MLHTESKEKTYPVMHSVHFCYAYEPNGASHFNIAVSTCRVYGPKRATGKSQCHVFVCQFVPVYQETDNCYYKDIHSFLPDSYPTHTPDHEGVVPLLIPDLPPFPNAIRHTRALLVGRHEKISRFTYLRMQVTTSPGSRDMKHF